MPTSSSISLEKLFFIIDSIVGKTEGRPDDEHSLPHGPWDPVIRLAWERFQNIQPQPAPWRARSSGFSLSREDLIILLAKLDPAIWEILHGGPVGPGGPNVGDKVSLNPHPLPPVTRFVLELAHVVIERTELIQEIAQAVRGNGTEGGGPNSGGYVSKFIDEVCGNGFRVWPFHRPRPHGASDRLNGVDLLVMATQFEFASKNALSPDLQQAWAEASAKLAKAGLARLP